MHRNQALSKKVVGALALILALNAGSQIVPSARAQNADAQGTTTAPGVVVGQPEGVAVVPPPPAGFDPMTASAEENRRYAIPPAPRAQAVPEAHSTWAAAVAGKAVHETPILKKTNIFNGSEPPNLR